MPHGGVAWSVRARDLPIRAEWLVALSSSFRLPIVNDSVIRRGRLPPDLCATLTCDDPDSRHCQLPFAAPTRRAVGTSQCHHRRERQREVQPVSRAATVGGYRSRWSDSVARTRRRPRLDALGGCGSAFPGNAQRRGSGAVSAAAVQSVICERRILLLDEPFGALDPGITADMHKLILDLWAANAVAICMT
jgi:hypothetical protein